MLPAASCGLPDHLLPDGTRAERSEDVQSHQAAAERLMSARPCFDLTAERIRSSSERGHVRGVEPIPGVAHRLARWTIPSLVRIRAVMRPSRRTVWPRPL